MEANTGQTALEGRGCPMDEEEQRDALRLQEPHQCRRSAQAGCYVRRYGRNSGVFNAAMNQADRKNAA